MASYLVTEIIEDGLVGKFGCYVSFNGKAAEYQEIESFDEEKIHEILQASAVADEMKDAEKAATDEAISALGVSDGRIVTS